MTSPRSPAGTPVALHPTSPDISTASRPSLPLSLPWMVRGLQISSSSLVPSCPLSLPVGRVPLPPFELISLLLHHTTFLPPLIPSPSIRAAPGLSCLAFFSVSILVTPLHSPPDHHGQLCLPETPDPSTHPHYTGPPRRRPRDAFLWPRCTSDDLHPPNLRAALPPFRSLQPAAAAAAGRPGRALLPPLAPFPLLSSVLDDRPTDRPAADLAVLTQPDPAPARLHHRVPSEWPAGKPVAIPTTASCSFCHYAFPPSIPTTHHLSKPCWSRTT